MIEEQELLSLLERKENLFESDIFILNEELNDLVSKSSFLVIGGAGSIGSSVSKEIFSRNPKSLFIIDINENNLTELVRDIRSSYGYITGKFNTAIIDGGSTYLEKLFKQEEPFDYVLNFSALKHVRSEKDPLTLMRMIEVNIMNTIYSIELSKKYGVKKYFCVSTDKAANPANIMGASKRLMELFVLRERGTVSASFARFANVLFSDGSLTYGFTKRFERKQPITAPNDIKRYFISPTEAGQLCLLSTMLGNDLDIFFPKLCKNLNEKTFRELAIEFLRDRGFEAFNCKSEKEALIRCDELIAKKYWPCHFFKSDTSGEKSFEEFHTANELVDLEKFSGVGLVKVNADIDVNRLLYFEEQLQSWRDTGEWDRDKLINIFKNTLPELQHIETGKNLDQRM